MKDRRVLTSYLPSWPKAQCNPTTTSKTMSALALRGHALTVPSHTGSETDELLPLSKRPSGDVGESQSTLPTLSHRMRHDSSILAIVLSDGFIYAGTQGGEILVYSLDTYERKAVIEGHRGSVLGLCLSQDQTLLFSSAGDRIVNVWNTEDLTRVYWLYSTYDVGDVFCVSYSMALHTVYLGAQNTTIQWYDLKERDSRPRPNPDHHPLIREDPFFDSEGPGGVRTPRPADAELRPRHAKGGQVLEIDRNNIRHFAHYGYVYCMLLAKNVNPEAAGEEILISGGGDGVIKFWRLNASRGGAIEELYKLDDGREEGNAVLSFALDGTFLYSGRAGGDVDVWDMETRQLVRSVKAHREDVLTISVGGGFLFSAATTGYVRKFDRQYQLKSRLKAHDGRVLASVFTFHKQRPIYVTGGGDHTVAVWDVSDCITAPLASARTSNERLFETLKRFVSYRTVSSDPRCQVDCRRGASYLRSVFKNFGAATEMLTTEDPYNPVILARFRGNPATASKRKKILFYGHYDVVAAEDVHGKWRIDPFAMEGRDGYLYGRGTSDNKGPIMAAIFACGELLAEQALGSDVIFLIEGEEECGSRGFEKTVQAHKDRIGNVDWILLANSYWLDDRIPCLTYGLRGVIHATVQVESSHPDLHSGVDGSAQLDESLKDLVMLLGTLTGAHGMVNIPGFYDPIPELDAEEEAIYADITQALVQTNPELGDAEAIAASLMRRWREASLTIHRFQTSGPDNATIIPRLAKAALSLRLVPNQDATEVAQALVSFLKTQFKKLGSNNRLTVKVDHQADPWLGDLHNALFKTLEEAIMDAWGPIDQTRKRRSSTLTNLPSTASNGTGYFANRPGPTTSTVLANGSVATPLTPLSEVTTRLQEASMTSQLPKQRTKPLYIREGGSIPAIRFLEKEFGAPAAHFPCGQASDSAHLDNERLRLVNLYKSKDIFKRVFRDLPQK